MEREIEHRLTEVEARSKSNTHRLEEVEKRQDNLDRLATSVGILAEREERDDGTGDGQPLSQLRCQLP